MKVKNSTLPPAHHLTSTSSSSIKNTTGSWQAALPSLPSSPGVYWFLDTKNKVLYVGKAKNLKKRLHSYTHTATLSAKIKLMVETAVQIKYQVLASELEALLIEAELIRLHQPIFNTLLKDDKTPLYIHLTQENFPRVLTLRKKDVDHLHPTGVILGPFPSSNKVKEVLKISRKIFPWCNQAGKQTLAQLKNQRACFYFHLQQCPGACQGLINKKQYQAGIHHLKLFLTGQKKTVLKNLQTQLKTAANNEDFELAATLRDQIQLIKAVTDETYRLKPTLVLPNLTNDLHQEALLHLTKLLTTYLKLPPSYPLKRIEGYDVSNTSGKLASVSMVTFIDAIPVVAKYRLFNIKTLHTPNDYQMLKEALSRRQNHSEWSKPNLVVIDGGKGQLRAALQVWGWSAPVISIAKNPDRIIFPIKIERHPKLEVSYHVATLPPNHPTLHLIQHIRDESHRFSKKQHTKRRLQNMLS